MIAVTYLEINLIALAMLLLIYINIHHRGEYYLYEKKLFSALVYTNAALLVLDSVQWLLIGKVGGAVGIVLFWVSTAYSLLTPFPCFLWSLYANYQVNRDEDQLKRIIFPLLVPMALSSVLGLMSIFNGSVFYVDGNNIYHRGNLFILMAAICFFYLAYTMVYITLKRNLLDKKTFYPLLLFAIPPFVGGVLQTLFYGISLVWVCMTLSVFIIFMSLQNNQLYTDHLTGLYNRRQLDNFLQEQLKNRNNSGFLAAIMMDLNSFKKINDEWGHDMGDRALIDAGKILEMSFRKSDLICRYGGDEFVVLLEVDDRSELEGAVNRLRKNADMFDHIKMNPYSIRFSLGYDIYDRSSGTTIQNFLKHIDVLMYEDKRSLKNSV